MAEKRHRGGWTWLPRSCPYRAQHIRCAHISGVYGGPSPFLLMLAWTLLLETSIPAASPFLCAIYLHGKKPWSYCHGEHCWKVAVHVWLLVLEDQSLSAQTTEAPYECVRGQRPQALGLLSPHNLQFVRGGSSTTSTWPAHGPLPLPVLMGRQPLARQPHLCGNCLKKAEAKSWVILVETGWEDN